MSETPVQDLYEKGKKWYQSRTIIGLIISSVGAIVYAVSNGEVDIAGAAGEVLTADDVVASVDQVWAAVLVVVGQVVALYGRLTAKVKIV